MKLVNRMSFLSSSVVKEIILSSETFYGIPPPFLENTNHWGKMFLFIIWARCGGRWHIHVRGGGGHGAVIMVAKVGVEQVWSRQYKILFLSKVLFFSHSRKNSFTFTSFVLKRHNVISSLRD